MNQPAKSVIIPPKHKDFVEQNSRSYQILALVLGVGGGLLVLTIFGIYFLSPSSLRSTGSTTLMTALGGLCALYYISLHQILKTRWLAQSTLVLVGLSLINLLLILVQTGGLSSPYYSLWLLVIVASGLFGGLFTGLALGSTVLYYLWDAGWHQFSGSYINAHLSQFLITLVAAGLAEWVYRRGRRSNLHQLHAATLYGQLSAEQFKADALMNSMADGVVVVDNQLKIQLLNPAAQNLTGWDQASAQNIHYRSVMSLKTAAGLDVADTNDPFVEAWTTALPVVKNNLTITTRAGRPLALSLSITPIYNDARQITGGIGVFRDISLEKEAERQRGEFISTASHEMRTPVAAIEGYISLALNVKVATIDDRARSYLEKAHDSIAHLGDLFRDLLSITKLEEGKVGKKLEVIDVGKLLKEAVTDMQFSATKKGLSLTYSPSISLGPSTHSVTPYYTVLAEPERLREVVMNLIDNAIKFTSAGGVTVRITGDDRSVTASVTDTGLGIASEDIPHLFQKFYRIDNSSTRTIGGTGLGLYLCRGLIELYNGRLWVESVVGQGSSFKFTLPRVNPEAANSPAASVPIATQTQPVASSTAVSAPAATAFSTPPSSSPAGATSEMVSQLGALSSPTSNPTSLK